MSRHTTLQHVIDQLHLGDAWDLKTSFPDDTMVQQCYELRVDTTRYLSKAFKYPITLLAAMFDSGCILSGSRALDFFIPGSATIDSDWDFYVPGYKESVADMIRALSLSGVTWDLEGDTITTSLSQDGSVMVRHAVLESLYSWISGMEPTQASELMGEKLKEVLEAFHEIQSDGISETYIVTRMSSGRISIQPGQIDLCQRQNNVTSYEDSAGTPFSMMRGFIETPSGIQSVQLIVGCHYSGIRSGLSFVKDFYASHVQCFISGWCASHMYYYHACSKNAVRWGSSYSTKSMLVEKAIRKYRERGFEFRRASPMDPTIRRFNDTNCFFVDFSNLYRRFLRKSTLDLFDNWIIERRKNINTINWVEYDRNIFSLHSPMDACLRDRTSYALACHGLPLAQLRRLGDMIAINCPEANELRHPSFRSSVRKTIAGSVWQVVEAARSGTIYCSLQDATPWSWVL